MTADEIREIKAPMKQVKYFHPFLVDGKPASTANIIWAERTLGSAYYRVSKYAMKAGVFPQDHPCCPGKCDVGSSQLGAGAAIEAFRGRGYWASCFPEGDGITLYWWNSPEEFPSKSRETVLRDIQECFGLEVAE